MAGYGAHQKYELRAVVVVPEVQPVPDKLCEQGRNGVAAAEAVDQAGSEGKPAPAGNGRTGRPTEPGEDGVVPSVPKAPSWRD
jgi:hypothetical protein